MRKRVAVAGSCWLIFFAGWAFGQATAGGNNGVHWKILTAFERNLYVLGFCRGYEQGSTETGGAFLEAIS